MSKLCKNIFNIVRNILLDIGTSNSRSGLGIVVKRVVVASSNSKELLWGVDIVAEAEVVDLVTVSLIAVGFEKHVKHIVTGTQTALSKSSKELVLGNMLVLCNIEVLEHLLEVNSLDLNCLGILAQNILDHLLLLSSHLEVSLSCRDSVSNSHGLHNSLGHFLNAVGGESTVDVSAEVLVVEHRYCFVSLVLGS